MIQDALRVDQLAVDRNRDVLLPQDFGLKLSARHEGTEIEKHVGAES